MKKISSSLLVLFLMIQMMTPIQAITHQWHEFKENNNVIQTMTTQTMEETNIAWSKDFTEGWDAISDPIIVDSQIYVASGTNSKLYKLDMNGQVLQEMTLAGSLGYNINITYGDGMIFIPISDGRIQAVDSQTMTSLWLSEKTEGYVQGKFTYQDGYLYVGSMNSAYPNSSGSFYALKTEDTDINKTDEVKDFTWEYASNNTTGGYNWAKAVIANETVYFGGNDGKLVAHHKTNNEVVELLDIGESISSALTLHNNQLYFSTKAGNVHSVELTQDGFGTHKKQLIANNASSTSSPTITNNRLYVGFGRGYGQNGGIAVLDATSLEVIYTKDTAADVQASPLVTTAYENNIAYFTMNNEPGGVYALVDNASTNTGEVIDIYIPTGDAVNYCMTSLIADQQGAIYHYNDSGFLTKLAANQTQSVRSIYDEKTGITAKGLFDTKGDLRITQVNDLDKVIHNRFENVVSYQGFNFLYSINNETKELLGNIEISMPYTLDTTHQLSLINIEEPKTTIPYTLEGSVLNFTISKAGTYALVETKEPEKTPVEDTDVKEVPNTGDKTNTYLFIGIGAVAVIGIIVLVVTKKKK